MMQFSRFSNLLKVFGFGKWVGEMKTGWGGKCLEIARLFELAEGEMSENFNPG